MDGLTKKLIGSVPKGILIGILLTEAVTLSVILPGCGKSDQQATRKTDTKSYANLPPEQQTVFSEPLYSKAEDELKMDNLLKLNEDEKKEVINILDVIVNRYPQSDYAPWALYQRDFLLNLEPGGGVYVSGPPNLDVYKKRIPLLERLLQEYGDSEFVKREKLRDITAVQLSIFYARLGDLKNAEKYFAKASRETIPSGYIPAYKTAKEELEALRKQK